MSTRYQDFIAVAEALAKYSESDAMLRTAVNRYYYGTLWLVRELFIPKPRRRNAHEQARDELGKRTSHSFRQTYEELYGLRAAAAYDLDEGQWHRKVVRARRLHDQIVVELRHRRLLEPVPQSD